MFVEASSTKSIFPGRYFSESISACYKQPERDAKWCEFIVCIFLVMSGLWVWGIHPPLPADKLRPPFRNIRHLNVYNRLKMATDKWKRLNDFRNFMFGR